MKLNQNKLFNPTTNTDIRMIGGVTNGIANLTDTRYPWSKKLYDTLLANFWIPEEIGIGQEAAEYQNFTIAEQEAFDKIISFLIFLDSFIPNALPYLSNHITAPEVQILLTVHAFQEAVHTQSYSYILESIVSAEKRSHIYNLTCIDDKIKSRNAYIAAFHQNFIDEPNDTNFLKVVVAQFILESIYFYGNFAFFYNLAKNNKMTSVSQIIAYINKDEFVHMALFANIYQELKKENPELFHEQFYASAKEMIMTAVDHEIDFVSYAYGDKIEGLTNKSMAQYIKYIANQRSSLLGLGKLYPEVKKNPLPFIEKMANPNMNKINFFENKPISYSKAGKTLNLDDIDNIEL